MAERLGRGLQSPVLRFESGRRLQDRESAASVVAIAFWRGPEEKGSNPSNEISSKGLLLRFSTTQMPWLMGTGVRALQARTSAAWFQQPRWRRNLGPPQSPGDPGEFTALRGSLRKFWFRGCESSSVLPKKSKSGASQGDSTDWRGVASLEAGDVASEMILSRVLDRTP